MAIIFEEKKQNHFHLILVFVVIVLIALVAIYFIFLKKQESFFKPTPIPSKGQKIEIDFDSLKDPRLEQLSPFKEIEKPNTSGRKNPFEPY